MNVVGLGPRVAKLQAYGVRANCRSSVPSVMVGESSAIQTTSSQASPEGLTRGCRIEMRGVRCCRLAPW